MVELEAVNLFRGLSSKELADLREISLKRRFTGGAQIFREGDLGDGLYVISHGTVKIAHLVGDEVRHVFSVLQPGAVFGEMAVIEDRPRSATALAAPEAELYFIPREEMRMLLQHTPVLAFNTLLMVSQRLRDFNQLHLQELVQSESLALVGRFAQGIVHDLKNPLSVIGLCADLFDLPNISPELRATAQSRIRKQVDRINNMVSDILIYSENKRREAALLRCRYHFFLRDLLPELRTEAEVRATQVELEEPLPEVVVLLDVRRLVRVFYNLMHNATDAMLNGGKILIRCRVEDGEVLTEIEDTGPGIAPEISGRLFQAFSSHGKTHGTGLGLSICKKIIEDHGGRIWSKTVPGRGAIFCFSLPLAK
jgi:signal transduction histidine kinase